MKQHRVLFVISLACGVLLPVGGCKPDLPSDTWIRTYGGASDDNGWGLDLAGDGGYIIAGFTRFYGDTDGGDVYLVKTDSSGDTVWTRTFGDWGQDFGWSVLQIPYGYIIACHGGAPVNNCYIKTDAEGNVVWNRTLGVGVECYSIRQTADGGYILAGSSWSDESNSGNVCLVKVDPWGTIAWTRTFGGLGTDCGSSVGQTTDGGYVIAGYTTSYGAGGSDIYLIRTNSSGDTVWTRTFGGASDDNGWGLDLAGDGGCIIVGQSKSYGAGNGDVYLVKTDSSGVTEWTEALGGSDPDWGSSVQQTADGGYVIAGWTSSFGTGGEDVYLAKVGALGDTIWTRTFGGDSGDRGRAVHQTTDGGYIVAGSTYSLGAGRADVYLIKTDAEGNAKP